MTTPIALTVAGSDSGGGAGIQADLKTFSALGVYGASVITALTAQNTREVRAIFDVTPDFVAQQIDCVFDDLAIDAVKVGMLGRPEIIEAVRKRGIDLMQVAPWYPYMGSCHAIQIDRLTEVELHLLDLAPV